jgi:hypothetical protein
MIHTLRRRTTIAFTLCPLRILTGTMSGFVMRSEYTRPWNTCAVPSSLLLANRG